MNSLVITKQTGNFFSFVLNGGSPIISEQNRLTTIGNSCNFKTASGANLILKQNILYSEITIVTGVSHIPTSINDLWVSLIGAGFFIGLGVGGGVSPTRFDDLLDTFQYFGRDGQLLIVNESELKLDTITLSVFSEADRIKLDGIATGAQVNVNPDWNIEDVLDKRHIFNRPSFIMPTFEFFDFPLVTIANTQTFEVPIGVVVKQVFVNKSQQLMKETANNIGDLDTFSQVGTILTINQPTEINNYISGFYQ